MSKIGKVYFVSAPGRIKIGYTRNPDSRLVKLRQVDMEELTVLAIIDGTRKLESRLHQSLSPHLLKGEWFSDCSAVREAMNECLSMCSTQNGDHEKYALSVLNEGVFVGEAAKICLSLLDAERRGGATSGEAISLVAIKTGLSHNRIWQLRYRMPNAVTAAEIHALRGFVDNNAVRSAKTLVGEAE